ncbi:SHOCT domain-containing protein [Streptomyces sp. NPDC001351]|uniref:SHOCT domain-containing protein n=1 Tax=Streptomyces sp. NPDC001351 TaxID=3364564 RepID=UPI0036948E49
MYWDGHDMNGWGWFTMSISTVLLWALLITVAVLLFRTLNRAPEPPRTPPTASPEQLLAVGAPPTPLRQWGSFARGEIDEEQYRRSLAVLRGDGPTLAKH